MRTFHTQELTKQQAREMLVELKSGAEKALASFDAEDLDMTQSQVVEASELASRIDLIMTHGEFGA